MPRPKGQKKTGGRQPGTPNKLTRTTRETIQRFIDGYIDDVSPDSQFVKDIKKLKPRERVTIVEKLIAYTLPKPQSIDISLIETEQASSFAQKLVELAANADKQS